MNRTFSSFRKRREEKYEPAAPAPTEPPNRLERRPEGADERPAAQADESTDVPSDDTTAAAGVTKPITTAEAPEVAVENAEAEDTEPGDAAPHTQEPDTETPAAEAQDAEETDPVATDADTTDDPADADAADVEAEDVEAAEVDEAAEAAETEAAEVEAPEVEAAEVDESEVDESEVPEAEAPETESADTADNTDDAEPVEEEPVTTPAPTADFDDEVTTRFAAVTPTPAPAVLTPAGSPADDKATERIDTGSEAATEKIDISKAAPVAVAASQAPTAARAGNWKAEAAAPQYIPAGGGNPQTRPPESAPKKSRKGLWISLAALIAIIAAVVVVVVLVAGGDEEAEVPPADVAADRALEYVTALQDGNIVVLRAITCGEAQQRFTTMSDQEFAADHQVQKANNELVGVDGVKASKIIDDGNGAVVEVIAYKTATPNDKLDVALTLSKIDGEWKVCKA
ncbi:DUF4878 domain-containing protein [Nocardia sp. 348MFTsu5.1]|uniref:Rv0361 family membrane protein n=1 Tax=Nocardia sp. 348MFTsu5.1 TaxID=1172185 RepID=UPI0018CA89F8|nr:DUF4878 domain-containing protein [Nocardia sp. 348MFTsu5.1]